MTVNNSDRQIALATKTTEERVRAYRKQLGVIPVYKLVDTSNLHYSKFTFCVNSDRF